MPTTRKKTVATMLAGALLAVASPALAHAQSSPSGDPTARPASASGELVGATRLKNRKSGKYLQAVSTANGARVVQQSYSDSRLQTWETYTFDGYYTYENSAAGRNLGIDGASTASGAAAIIANGSSDLNQDWERDWTDNGYFRMINHKSGLCLGISGASTANGAQAAQFRCDGSTNQQWTSEG
ncbi:RICIN domain-containing protein [Streptomyces sp. S.PNR 29]|uniref:RICIN domain-containing protein n=1 Tax=Streptomyces sp. S.PNR 29 TaxID=2973805 RepID=UPI0025B1EF3D|nr:RICIN domain-containing protein [Streptomyces sp. S.PNR 29]MDN0200780.1 RICIN domain-containing protein [Streptomyces sp. S.PNR 29]